MWNSCGTYLAVAPQQETVVWSPMVLSPQVAPPVAADKETAQVADTASVVARQEIVLAEWEVELQPTKQVNRRCWALDSGPAVLTDYATAAASVAAVDAYAWTDGREIVNGRETVA